ncbi:MAG: phosphogluconate dehydrogenase (NAD(+)-dependent, decarboxylating) [Pseudomonadota bacterium]
MSQPNMVMVGLGRMGGGIVRRWRRAGLDCAAYDTSSEAVASVVAAGAAGLSSLNDIASLPAPRTVWIMVPAGAVTDGVVNKLAGILSAGDCVIDGGNGHYKSDPVRAAELGSRGIDYMDVGVSGGVWGLEEGYALMIGGDADVVARHDAFFAAMAPGEAGIPATEGRAGRDQRPERGYLHCGPVGSGHFVKMVHNGIEYGMMQAFAEGFDVLKHAGTENRAPELRFDLDLADIAEVWRRGSVIRSWLLDLNARALVADPELDEFKGEVGDSGEARWTLEAAIEEEVPVPTIAMSLFARFRSRRRGFADKMLSAMRAQFGGHKERT